MKGGTSVSNSPLDGLVIRTACVRQPGLGYICAYDPAREAAEIPHAISFRYHDGEFRRGDANFNVVATTMVSQPGIGLLSVSPAGDYSLVGPEGNRTGNLFDESMPPSATRRLGGVRAMATIAGHAHVVGLRGLVYRFDGPGRWVRLDEDLPDTFEGQAIDGHALDALVAVGREGAIWRFNGREWAKDVVPTAATLTSLACGPDGMTWAAGHGGALLVGRHGVWRVIAHGISDDPIWDLAFFQGTLYASTMRHVYALRGNTLEPVSFGGDTPASCYQLSVADGVMWSNGEFDVMSFDGARWSRVV